MVFQHRRAFQGPAVFCVLPSTLCYKKLAVRRQSFAALGR